MPEIIEIEQYRQLATTIEGLSIDRVTTPDAWFLKRGLDAVTFAEAAVGRRVERTDRRGKLLMLILGRGPIEGLRFGMTGRLVVDGKFAVDKLEYGSDQRRPEWIRVRIDLSGGHTLAIDDPRRFGGVELDPDLDVLGPDAFALSRRQLAAALAGGRGPIKARLMDQRRVAGLGNLLTDEVLWRAGIDPGREAQSLVASEIARLHRAIEATLAVLSARGGSHTGDLQIARVDGASCPRRGCSGAIVRRTIGGRTTYSCGRHQR